MRDGMTRRKALRAAGATAVLAATGTHSAGEPAGAEADGGLPHTYKDGRYTLPKLPYAYDALQPLYEERTLRIHHTKHHAGYVRGLNATLEKLQAADKAGDYASIKALSRDLAFNGSGHVLHSLFWHSMAPGGAKMDAALAEALKESFGSPEAGTAQFAAACGAVEGSGWGILAYEPLSAKVIVLQAEKHQNLTVWNAVPLLVCDVWEHAYYLQYANNRGEWVEAFMKLANWPYAAARLARARKSPLA